MIPKLRVTMDMYQRVYSATTCKERLAAIEAVIAEIVDNERNTISDYINANKYDLTETAEDGSVEDIYAVVDAFGLQGFIESLDK